VIKRDEPGLDLRYQRAPVSSRIGMMFRKLIWQNRLYFFTVSVLFVFLAAILLIGQSLIYNTEAARQHALEQVELSTAEEKITAFFSDTGANFSFLPHVPSFSAYADSGFQSEKYANEVSQLIQHFLENQAEYRQFEIVNQQGLEVMHVDAGIDPQAPIVQIDSLKNQSDAEYFQKALELNRDELYVSPLYSSTGDEGIRDVPVFRLAAPIVKTNGEKSGVFAATISFEVCLRSLPQEIFVQTPAEELISIRPDGGINFSQSNLQFTEDSGLLEISADTSVHYVRIHYLGNNELVVAKNHAHPLLAEELNRLILAVIGILAILLLIIWVISYINLRKSREIIEAERAIISALAGLAEGRDPETGHHLEKTRTYTITLARQLSKKPSYHKTINRDFLENIYDAVQLHDIGKVGIRDSILLKNGKLTDGEFEEMKQHVRIGKEVIQNAIGDFKLNQPFLLMGRNICEYHHEKVDGTGYLKGLAGEDILIEARIFAVCDAYDAIRSKRPYKEALPHEEAVNRIKNDRGKHFDPDVVDAFLECEREFARIEGSFAIAKPAGNR
jgi:HD-GYP domain-containing protein (c-di-GMP phosphodiesterase class II)